MNNPNPRTIVVVALTVTICLILLSSVIVALFHPPGSVSETFRAKTFEVITFILGMVGGWLLSKGEQPPPKT